MEECSFRFILYAYNIKFGCLCIIFFSFFFCFEGEAKSLPKFSLNKSV
jgi:hypothetical protein